MSGDLASGIRERGETYLDQLCQILEESSRVIDVLEDLHRTHDIELALPFLGEQGLGRLVAVLEPGERGEGWVGRVRGERGGEEGVEEGVRLGEGNVGRRSIDAEGGCAKAGERLVAWGGREGGELDFLVILFSVGDRARPPLPRSRLNVR